MQTARIFAAFVGMAVTLAAHAQTAGSSQVARPGGVTPAYPLPQTGLQGADSVNAATVTNWTPSTANIANAGAACPAGWVWGAPYGVANCLRPIDKCEAAYLTWIQGDAICQGFAPATAAFFYVPKRYYQGNLVSRCPEGSSVSQCMETYVREDSPPISVLTVGPISDSIGAAAAICRSGVWSINTSNCRLPNAH
jgi:hypothetical protein